MVHGKAGMKLEALKFGVYVGIPIMASAAFNYPPFMDWAIDRYRYVEYPPEKYKRDDLEKMRKDRIENMKRQKIIQSQLKQLNIDANKKVNVEDAVVQRRWWNWFAKLEGRP